MNRITQYITQEMKDDCQIPHDYFKQQLEIEINLSTQYIEPAQPPRTPAQPSLIAGCIGMILTMTATAIGTGLWLGLAGAVAWRVFRGLT